MITQLTHVYSLLIAVTVILSSATFVSAQEETVIPGDPELCETEPLPDSYFQPYVGTPTPLPQEQISEATPDVVEDPEGNPADAETIDATVAILTQFKTCSNAGQTTSVAALVDPALVERAALFNGAEFFLDEQPASASPSGMLVEEILETEDGQIIATVSTAPESTSGMTVIRQRFFLEGTREGLVITENVLLEVIMDD